MGKAVTQDEIRKMAELNRTGFTSEHIAARLNRPLSTVQKYLRGRLGSNGRGRVTVLKDPTNTFPVGAEFGGHDLAGGLCEHAWPNGLRFVVEYKGHCFQAEVQYRIVADDGRVLEAKKGGSYKWTQQPERA